MSGLNKILEHPHLKEAKGIVGARITSEGFEYGVSPPESCIEHVIGNGTVPYGGVSGFSESIPPKRENEREVLGRAVGVKHGARHL